MELRSQYVCDICGKIYHNIVCGEKSEATSICFSCSTNSKKAILKPAGTNENDLARIPSTKPRHNSTNKNKDELEELLREEDFGKYWFYKTNDELEKEMHFFHVYKEAPPRMYMVKPKDVLLHDLQVKVCFLCVL